MRRIFVVFIIFLNIIILSPQTLMAKPIAEDSKGDKIINNQGFVNAISWQAKSGEKGITIIPGSVQSDFGRFEFRWVIDASGSAGLMTLEPAGSAELPLLEKKIFLLVLNDGTSMLFQEWFPLANAKTPYTIRLVATVPTKDLFSVLPSGKTPPASTLIREPSPLTWGEKQTRRGAQYLEGTLKASFGTLNIYWKKEAGRVPDLITLESPGAGELPPVESRLIPWIDESTGTTAIFQERYPQLNQAFVPYLWCLAAVKTDELLAGFKQ